MYLELPIRIDERKLTHYLLIKLDRDDKSNYLSLAGYNPTNWERLKIDLTALATSANATLERGNGYGMLYSVAGQLPGTNGRSIWVKTIWMRDVDEEITNSSLCTLPVDAL
jgi:hypothetical protein